VPKISTYLGRSNAELEVSDLEIVQAAPVMVEAQPSLLS
jgi:hypothetical protein